MVIFSYGMGNVSAASSDSIYVNGLSGNDVYNGLNSTWTSGLNGPKKTIKNATGTVTSNGTVHITQGTYNENNIQINTNMTIIGENQNNTIINGLQSGNLIFTIASGVNITIINLTLTNATSNNYGGAIYNRGTLTVWNSTFTNNTAAYAGGAICNYGGTLTVENSTFTGNTANGGGAIIIESGTMTVKNSTFTNNTGMYGGAIENDDTLSVENSTFTNNTASSWGGAIENSGTLSVENSTFTRNTGMDGSGAIENIGTLTVEKSSFTNNTSNDEGGAIRNAIGTLTVENSSFTNNTANKDGGAISNYGTMTVENSTFANNTVNGDASAITYGGAIFNVNTARVNYNQIIGNRATYGSAIYNKGGTVDAGYNWWGSNLDPSANISGSGVTYNPWIILTVKPATIDVDGKSTITANLLYDSNVVYHDPVNGHVPDGITVIFSSDTKGSVNPINVTIKDGSATTTFTGLQFGLSQVSAKVDAQTETITVNIKKLPTTITIDPVTGLNGKTVNLIATLIDSYGNLVSGASVQFSVNGVNVGTVTTDSKGIATLSYPITQKCGTYTILANYLGNNTYTASSNTNTLTVTNIPTAKANPTSGLYNTTKTVTLTMNKPGTIYYTLNGTTPTITSKLYTGPLSIKSTTTLKYLAVDTMGNQSNVYSETYTIDKIPPKASANIKTGLYNTTKTVKLTMNKKGTIYYTINGTTPTTTSKKYSGPVTIKSTTTLKYLAVDLAGNKSPVYTNKYTIDKTAPKVVSTKPKNNSRGVSLTTSITIKFSEKISKTTNFSKIHIKNLTIGKITHTTTKLSGNTITVKMIRSRLSLNHYQVYIPTKAVKDTVGNTNKKYILNFKTSRY